jgi:hypothetical protein
MLKKSLYLLAGWFLPGLGHIIYGKRFKGFLYLVLIVSLILTGVYLQGEIYSPNIWKENAEHTLGPYLPLTANFFTGIFFLIARFSNFANGHIRSANFELANTYILVAGFLNLLVLVDLFDYLIAYPKRDQREKNEKSKNKGEEKEA